MIVVARQLSPNYSWEIALFHQLRDFSDGLTFLDLRIDWDRYPISRGGERRRDLTDRPPRDIHIC
jgi:hypothetical protein